MDDEVHPVEDPAIYSEIFDQVVLKNFQSVQPPDDDNLFDSDFGRGVDDT